MSLDPAATMRRFGECNHPPGFHTPAVFQPGKYLDVRRLHGFFVVEIDDWTWLSDHGLLDEAFDVDAWEAMTLRLIGAPELSARRFWRCAFSLARRVIKGRRVWIDGTEHTLETWAQAARVLARAAAPIKPQKSH